MSYNIIYYNNVISLLLLSSSSLSLSLLLSLLVEIIIICPVFLNRKADRMSLFCGWIRPVSMLKFSKPRRFVDSKLLGNSLWTWEFHPLNLRFCSSQTLWNPESWSGDWPYARNKQARPDYGGALVISTTTTTTTTTTNSNNNSNNTNSNNIARLRRRRGHLDELLHQDPRACSTSRELDLYIMINYHYLFLQTVSFYKAVFFFMTRLIRSQTPM